MKVMKALVYDYRLQIKLGTWLSQIALKLCLRGQGNIFIKSERKQLGFTLGCLLSCHHSRLLLSLENSYKGIFTLTLVTG